MSTSAPVYVAGLERSGTSLMYALLASHPRLAMTRRTNLWTYFYGRYGDLSDPTNLAECLDVMRRYKRLAVLDVDWVRLESAFRNGPSTYPRLFDLIERQYADRLGRPRWGDKSLNTERYAEEIFEAFPDARIIHMMRDPRDRFASVMARWKVRRGGVGAGTAEWVRSERLAVENERRFPDRYKVLRYEDLAADPEIHTSAICDFIGEDYRDEMLSMRGAETFRDQGSNSSYGKRDVGVISTSSIGRYVQVLSPMEVAFIEARTSEGLERWNYAPQGHRFGSGDAFIYRSLIYPRELGRMRGWEIRDSYRNRKGRTVPGYRFVEQADET